MRKSPRVREGSDRPPARVVGKVGSRVALEQPDDHLADDPAADRPESKAILDSSASLST